MNYLKSAVKKWYKRGIRATTRFFRPTMKRFAGSQLPEESRRRRIHHFSSIFSQRTLSARSNAIPGEKLSIMFSVELFNILAPV
jgi:hypothetical protein